MSDHLTLLSPAAVSHSWLVLFAGKLLSEALESGLLYRDACGPLLVLRLPKVLLFALSREVDAADAKYLDSALQADIDEQLELLASGTSGPA